MLTDPSMVWMSNIAAVYTARTKRPYRGVSGEDWEITARLFADQAQLAKYTVWTNLLEGKNVGKQEYVRLLTILVSFFSDGTPALTLVEKNKVAFERYLKDYPTATADCQSLFTTLMASLRRLSKADDSFWYWTKYFAEYRVKVKPGLDLMAELWSLDKMFDKLQDTINSVATNNGGHLKPSSLTPIPIEKGWISKMRNVASFYEQIDLQCGEEDDPALVVKSAMAANQKELDEAEKILSEMSDQVSQLSENPTNLTSEEASSLQDDRDGGQKG